MLETSERWQEHYATVFNGSVVEIADMREDPRPASTCSSTMNVGPAATEQAFKKLGRNKGVGKDAIPAELLQAGERAIATKYSEINERVLENASWPTQWRGGGITSVYKNKGEPEICDNSRGILLADHSGKALAGIVKRAIDPHYDANQPDNSMPLQKKGLTLILMLSSLPWMLRPCLAYQYSSFLST